jgi:hypothetical protein
MAEHSPREKPSVTNARISWGIGIAIGGSVWLWSALHEYPVQTGGAVIASCLLALSFFLAVPAMLSKMDADRAAYFERPDPEAVRPGGDGRDWERDVSRNGPPPRFNAARVLWGWIVVVLGAACLFVTLCLAPSSKGYKKEDMPPNLVLGFVLTGVGLIMAIPPRVAGQEYERRERARLEAERKRQRQEAEAARLREEEDRLKAEEARVEREREAAERARREAAERKEMERAALARREQEERMAIEREERERQAAEEERLALVREAEAKAQRIDAMLENARQKGAKVKFITEIDGNKMEVVFDPAEDRRLQEEEQRRAAEATRREREERLEAERMEMERLKIAAQIEAESRKLEIARIEAERKLLAEQREAAERAQRQAEAEAARRRSEEERARAEEQRRLDRDKW